MASKKPGGNAILERPAVVAEASAAELGIYRCPRPHPDFPGRPCNRRMGAGAGPYTNRCPRCGEVTSFAGPNA